MPIHRTHSPVAAKSTTRPAFRFWNSVAVAFAIAVLTMAHSACTHRAKEPDAQGTTQGQAAAPQEAGDAVMLTQSYGAMGNQTWNDAPVETQPLAQPGENALSGAMKAPDLHEVPAESQMVSDPAFNDASMNTSASTATKDTAVAEHITQGASSDVSELAAEHHAPGRARTSAGHTSAGMDAARPDAHGNANANTKMEKAPETAMASQSTEPTPQSAVVAPATYAVAQPIAQPQADAATDTRASGTTQMMASDFTAKIPSTPADTSTDSSATKPAAGGSAWAAQSPSGSQTSVESFFGIHGGWLALFGLLLLLIVLFVLRGRRRAAKDPIESSHGSNQTREHLTSETPNPVSPQGKDSVQRELRKPLTSGEVYTLNTRPRSTNLSQTPAQVVSLPSRNGRLEVAMSDAPVVQVISAEVAEPAAPAATQAETMVAAEAVAAPAATTAETAACIAEAKRLLTANQPADALQALEPALALPHAPAEAWVIAGWARWRIATDASCGEPMEAATSAARAFEHALRLEPKRSDLLTRLARCHLLRAEHATGKLGRGQCMDQALATFARRSELRPDQAADKLEMAQVLLRRAELSPRGEDAGWLAQAGQMLGEIPGQHPLLDDADARRTRIDMQLALARQGEGAAAARLYADAIDSLSDEVARAEPASCDAWLLKLIDAAREQIQCMQGASRILRLQALKAQVAPYLAKTEAVAPLLSWINLLDDWAGLLHARAAQAKLAEADALFERVAYLPAKGQAGIQFARAYYLRLRARYEHGATQLRTLEQALERLGEIPADALPAALIEQERAEIQLRIGRHLGMKAGESHFRLAAEVALRAAAQSATPEPAWVCAAFALGDLAKAGLLSTDERAELRELGQRLEQPAPAASDALRAAALIRLLDGDFATSSALCESAWRSGAARDDILPLWREADERWAQAMPESSRDPHWRQLHQRMRLATSSH